jgi:Uma2 family endonuclease
LVGALAGGEFGIRFSLPDDPDQVRGLDVCYLSPEQVARYETSGPNEYFREVPALVAEVISPSESADYVDEKLSDYLAGGARLVWLLYPRSRTVKVYSPDAPLQVVPFSGVLTGDVVLPDFSLAVATLFS